MFVGIVSAAILQRFNDIKAILKNKSKTKKQAQKRGCYSLFFYCDISFC